MVNDDFEKTSIVSSDTFKGRLKAADEAPPSLVVLVGPQGYVGKQFPLTQNEVVLGRSVECHVFIDDKSVSRSHAKMNLNGSEVAITDLGSSNKTVVNETVLSPMTPRILKNNDQIKTGNVIFKYLEKGNLEAAANKELNEKAQKDALTGAYSKGALIEKGPEAVKRSEVLTEELSVLVFDLDHFKKVNDNYGHAAGDYVLKEMSHVISTKMIRGNDFFARYGGEEFVILLPGAGIKTAIEIAERIRSTVEGTDFRWEGTRLPITISMGVGSRLANENNWEILFKRVDEASYKSKQSGRNRVTAAN
jgi:two-component system cell cycle response regulator